MPSESFSHSAVAHAPIDVVWAELDQPSTWESIGGIDRVVDSRTDPQGRLTGFSFDSLVAGKAYRGEAVSAGRDEGRMMSWDIENSEVSGTIEVTLAGTSTGTRVDVSLEVRAKGLLSSMFFSVVAKAVGNGLPASVDDFAAGFD